MTPDELLQRMDNGERLRWLPRSVSGIEPQGPASADVTYRDLFLGSQLVEVALDENFNGIWDAIYQLKEMGVLIEHDYELEECLVTEYTRSQERDSIDHSV